MVSSRLQQVQSPVIPIIGDLIRANPGTISLGQGVVHWGPPPEATQMLARFMDDPENHKYKPVQGIPQLLEAIRVKLEAENGIAADPERELVVSAGGNMAFMNAVLAIADPGDEIILLTPYYFNHEMAVMIAGCTPVLVPTDENYQPNLEAIEAAITERTRAIVTISPNNPTGAVYPEATLRAINELCRERGIYHISDEAYEYFVYGSAHHFSPGSMPGAAGHTISLFSLSKSYGFASWRVGYMVVPERLLTAVKKIQDTILICAPVVSQFAGLGCMQAGKAYCDEQLHSLRRVRAWAFCELESLGDRCVVNDAEGAFYFFLRVNTALPAMQIAERLIRDYKVAPIPGDTFGMSDATYLRISYGALHEETATEGLGRLVQGLHEIVPSPEF